VFLQESFRRLNDAFLQRVCSWSDKLSALWSSCLSWPQTRKLAPG